MLKNKLFYLLLLVIAMFFLFFYSGYLSFLLFLTFLVLPWILWGIAAWCKSRLQVELVLPRTAVTRGDELTVIFSVKNTSLFPIACARLEVSYQNLFHSDGQLYRESVWVSLSGRHKQDIIRKIRSDNCGNLQVSLSNICVFDYFRLCGFRKKINQELMVTVLPSIISLEETLPAGWQSADDSDVFSSEKPGDDPSEIFDIRDYREGDRMQRIHWNLTLKQGHYMVRDFSLPCKYSVLLAVDLYEEGDIDTVLEALVSVSYFLISQGVPHEIVWYDQRREEYQKKRVAEVENLFSIMGNILELTPYQEEVNAMPMLLSHGQNQNYSRIFYFRPGIPKTVPYRSDAAPDVQRLTVICAAEGTSTEQLNHAQEDFAALSIPLFPVAEGKLRECLNPMAFI